MEEPRTTMTEPLLVGDLPKWFCRKHGMVSDWLRVNLSTGESPQFCMACIVELLRWAAVPEVKAEGERDSVKVKKVIEYDHTCPGSAAMCGGKWDANEEDDTTHSVRVCGIPGRWRYLYQYPGYQAIVPVTHCPFCGVNLDEEKEGEG